MLLHLDDVDKFYGARRVLADVRVTVRTGDKIGVVGPNGGGKSTLLRLLAGREEPDEGRREAARGAAVGFLGQLVAFAPEHEARTAEAYLRDALRDVDGLAERVRELEEQLARPELQADPEGLDRAMERYAAAASRFEATGGYEAAARLRATAFGLGFDDGDLARPVGGLSGGQKVRLALARLLLSAPDVLLLDEPTNHLDTETTEWLETFLRRAPQAVVVVSHDRYFLDAVTERTWDVDGGRVAVYPAAYTRAQALKLEALQRQRALQEKQRAEVERLERFVERYRAGVKARQARGRAARLARMEPETRSGAAVRDAGAAVDGLGAGRARRRAGRRGVDGALRQRGPRLALAGAAEAGRTGREALRVRGAAKAFGGRPVLQDVDVVVERGGRIGVVGPNGSGKTTLLRLLAGELAPEAGEVIRGSGVRIGYFAQGQQDLDAEATIVDHVREAAGPEWTEEEARRYLARFLFFGDEIYAPTGRLSGGERNRVSLARLILQRPNVLLLDEPTNHLDVAARISLETALAEFDGAIVAVSHDRYFLESVCDRLWIVQGGRVETFIGSYSQWAEGRAAEAASDADLPGGRVPSSGGGGRRGEGGPEAVSAAEHRRRRQEERRRRQRLARQKERLAAETAAVEQQIEELEAERAAYEERLADPDLYADGERVQAVAKAHRRTEDALAAAFARWEALLEEQEGLPEGD